MAVLVGLVGLASKYAAFRRPGGVPVRLNDGTVLLISVSTYRASKSFFYFSFISEKYYMGRAFLKDRLCLLLFNSMRVFLYN